VEDVAAGSIAFFFCAEAVMAGFSFK
jgi:hypothetical protein